MALFTAIGAGIGALAGGGLTGALVGAGIGMQAGSAYYNARGAKAQANYNKMVALNNAKIAEDNAADVRARGRVAVFDQRRRVAQELSNVRAATAASGLVVDEAGTTPQDMVASMAVAGELDVSRLKNNIAREERRALIQGVNFQAEAGQFELQRSQINPLRSAFSAGFGAATSGLSGDILFGGLKT